MEAIMPRTSKEKRKSEVVPAVGIVGLSLSMAGGASAAAALPVGGLSAQEVRPEVSAGLQLHEEEIADVSLATFYLFDKEEASTTRDGNVQLAGWRGCRCGGWRGCRGCWGWGGAAGGGAGAAAAGAGAAAGAAGVVAADADADRADLLTATTI